MTLKEYRVWLYLSKVAPCTKWEIKEAVGFTFASVDVVLRNLRKAGLVECLHGGRRGRPYKWKALKLDLWERNEDDQLA